MMMSEIDRQVYYYIIQIEVNLLMRYKINSFDLSDKMTVSDIQSYMEIIAKNEEEQRKQNDNQKGLWKSLMGIRDILNVMSYNK